MAEYISEHQSPTNTSSDAPTQGVDLRTQNQSDEQRAIVQGVEKDLAAAKRARRRHDKNWQDYYKYFLNNQWKEKRPRYRHMAVLNHITDEILTVLSILTDIRPIVDAQPEEPSDFDFAEVINKVIRSRWEKGNFGYTTAEVILDGGICGTGLVTVPWDQELDKGVGDFDYRSVDPFMFYPSPLARKINDPKTCDYVIEAELMEPAKVRRKWPKMGHLVTADVSGLETSATAVDDDGTMHYQSPVDDKLMLDEIGSSREQIKNHVLVICRYQHSHEVIEEQLEDEIKAEGGSGIDTPAPKTYRKKYPKGRKTVVANGILLEDGPNPYEDGLFPYARYVNQIIPREFWGMGDVLGMKDTQDIINRIISYVLDVMIATGNPIWVIDDESDVDPENLFNAPGDVVVKAKGSEVRREAGTQLQPYIMNLLQFMSGRMVDRISGINEVSRGAAPGAGASGVSIAQLQEAAQTRLRSKSRNLEVFLTEVGELIVSRILQYYRIPRIVRITGNSRVAEFMRFNVDQNDDGSYVANVETIQQDPESNQFQSEGVKSIPLKRGRLDVRMTAGSELPFVKQRKVEMAERNFDRGVFDAEDLLEAQEYPKKERILEKYNQRQQQMAEQQAMQGGNPNGSESNAAGPAA